MTTKVTPGWLSQIDGELLDALVDNPYECPIVIDRQGIIRFMSRYNAKIYGMKPEETIGRHISEVSKHTRMHEVLKTGKAEIGKAMRLGNRQQIVARIPLKDRRGNIVGVLGKLMFHQTEKIRELYNRVESLEEQLRYYRKEISLFKGSGRAWEQIVGESQAIQDAKKAALQAASTDASVLILGESGTGKELFANAIHFSSRRAGGPFIKVNCAAIPGDLIESELFGYKAGAFTGADSHGKPGKFELANGGTIFLDEIGDMSMALQAKLLRVIQEHEVERIGGFKPTKLDIRILAATNKDLLGMIERGIFRADLFYRLNIFQIRAPGLREIQDDIPRIAYYFLSFFRRKKVSSPTRISPAAMALLEQYPWPGNARELRNIIERAMHIAEGNRITPHDLPDRIRAHRVAASDRSSGSKPTSLRRILEEAEKEAIMDALKFTAGNKARAARMLGIHRTGLYQKLKRHEIDV